MSTTRTASTLVRSLRLLPVAAAVAGVAAFGGVAPAAAPADSGTVMVTAAAKTNLGPCKVAVTKARPTSAVYGKCDVIPGRF